MMYDLIVIGSGPAGILAACSAQSGGAKVLLVEKNPSLGKKLLITGKGRCNITNAGNIQEFITSYNNGKFLYQAFSRYFNDDLIKLFESFGVETKVERGGRVFPVSDRSEDIVQALEKYLKKSGVTVMFSEKVERVVIESARGLQAKVCGVKLAQSDKVIKTGKVIVATGGLSYPGTGSTGDGYRMAEELGHKVVPLLPALVPMITREKFVRELAGLSLKNVRVTAFADGKEIGSDYGEMLFTHFGVSGPIILTLSGAVAECLAQKKKVYISINFKMALDRDTLTARLLREFDGSGLKTIANILKTLIPQSLIPVFLGLSGIDPEKKGSQISRNDREAIYKLLSDFRLDIAATRNFEDAIVTRGGVSLKEIDPRTMESKIIAGLYFCGEVIDIDGVTGGYNLQAAFSTGYLAGYAAAKSQTDASGE
jgi:hypothetical protein